jgi:hypothetical protein
MTCSDPYASSVLSYSGTQQALISFDCLCKSQLDYFYFLMASDRTLDFGKRRSGTAMDYDWTLMPRLHFYFGQKIVSNGLITFCLLCGSSLPGTPWISKSFKLPTFWLLDSASGLHGLLKWKGTFFLGNKSSYYRLLCL